MLPVDDSSQIPSFCGRPLPGDYHRCSAEEEHTRGFSVVPADLPDRYQALINNPDHEVMRSLHFDSRVRPEHILSSFRKGSPNSSMRFRHFQNPPDLPTEREFELATTTFTGKSSAADCMNRLLDFFETEMIAEVTRVCTAKFVVKADVFDKGMFCSLKFRAYRLQNCGFHFEFQRLSGDIVAFHRVFQQAHFKLELPLTFEQVPADVLPPLNQPICSTSMAESQVFANVPPPLNQPARSASCTRLAPLIDMLLVFDAPKLQAEAAASLASIASCDPDSIVAMCSTQLFEHLNLLLQIDRIDVAFPIACLLSSLADCAAASALFSEYDLVKAMEEQMLSPQKTVLAKQQLEAAIVAWYRHGL